MVARDEFATSVLYDVLDGKKEEKSAWHQKKKKKEEEEEEDSLSHILSANCTHATQLDLM